MIKSENFIFKPWTILSQAEASLSKEIASFLVSRSKNKKNIGKDILELATSFCDDTHYSKNIWLQRFPLLEKIDLESPFPKQDDHISTNLFGIISYEVISLLESNGLKGVAGTPTTLAVDMVRAALHLD